MIKENNHCIYMHENKINHKKYIGQCAGNPERRWRTDGSGYLNRCPKFSDAIKKYGWDNFDHIILKENLTLEEANYWEAYYIAYYHTWIDDPQCWGYNLQKGGKNTIMSQETRKKLSLINSGEGNPHYGTHCSEETKKKLILKNGQKIKCIETGIIYNSMNEAERLTGIPNTNISKACRGLRKTAGGYHWEKIYE
jgi:group I intron endonuclease